MRAKVMSSSADVMVRCCVVLVMWAYPAMCRVSAELSYIPVCYRDNVSPGWSFFERCNHPLYTTCRADNTSPYLCCGPDHECCQNGQACCQKTSRPWSVYEVVGVVMGITAWLGIITVIVIFTLPHCIRAIKKQIRERKVAPKEDKQQKYEMNDKKKKSRTVPIPAEDSRSERILSSQQEENAKIKRRMLSLQEENAEVKRRMSSQQEENAEVKRRMSHQDNRRVTPPDTDDTGILPQRAANESKEGVKQARQQAHMERVQELENKVQKEREEKTIPSRRPSNVDPSQPRRPSQADSTQPRPPSKESNQQRPMSEAGTSKQYQEPAIGISVQSETRDDDDSKQRPVSNSSAKSSAKSSAPMVPVDVDLA